MKCFKYLIPFILALSCRSAITFADAPKNNPTPSRYSEELAERETEMVNEFLEARKEASLEKNAPVETDPVAENQEKICNLIISGDVRTEWRHLTERTKHTSIRPRRAKKHHDQLPLSRNDFDFEFNLRFEYTCERSWAVAHLQFDNSGGVDDNGRSCKEDPEGFHGSGESNDIDLKRAYWGYNIFTCDDTRLDIEIGRRRLYDVFDSEIEFFSRFDGILLKYNSNLENISDYYLKLAAFIIDERVNHFGYVGEFGFLNIYDTGIDFKYSFIYWNKYGKNRCGFHNPEGFKFQISQWILKYHFNPDFFCGYPAEIYSGFLYNHDRHYTHFSEKELKKKKEKAGKNENRGWYIGFLIGEVVKAGDWSIDIEYQYVEANAIPDDDVSGIGRGNFIGSSFTETGRGNANYKGWRFEGLYALTDNLSLNPIIEFTRAANKKIGGLHHYSKFELEAIYAF